MTSDSADLKFGHSAFQGRFGIARADITPPVGVYSRCWGAAAHDTADSIHRPLQLTVLVLSSHDDDELILIDADLGWWKTPGVYQKFAAHLLEAVQVPTDWLIFALTHTHAGPPLMDPDEDLPGSDLLGPWMEQLLQTAIDSIQLARQEQFAGVLEWASGHCGLAAVRDLPDPNGDRFLCGFEPAEPADETLILGRITDDSGKIRATLSNYACHPTTLAWENTSISPDYIGSMRETIETQTAAPALFLLGMCGELAPRHQYSGDPSVADQHGRVLGFASLSTLENMNPAGQVLAWEGSMESGAPLAVWRHSASNPSQLLKAYTLSVPIPLKDWPSADALEAERRECKDRAMEERLRRKRDIRRGIGDGDTWELTIWIWQLGDALLVGTCCEPYSVLQQAVRRAFPDRSVVCMNLINGSIGYLPPADLYDHDVYPVWQTPFDRGSLEIVMEAMISGIRGVLEGTGSE